MSIFDDFISALGKATEIIDPRIGGGIIPLLAQEPQKKLSSLLSWQPCMKS